MKLVQLHRPYRGKSLTLHTVLTDYNTQMLLFSLCNPCSVHRVHEMQCVQYLFIYLSLLALNTTLTATLNSTVFVLDSSQSPSPIPLPSKKEYLKT